MNVWVFCCIVFVASTSSCYGFCQFPPALWCSSPEIVEECHVSSQCQGWSCLAQVDAKPVDVVVYYESSCFDCRDFINNKLNLAHKEVGEIMNVQLVPYGDTEEVPDGDSWRFTCQQGNYQCSGNLLQACVLHLITNISVQFPLIECMMASSGDPEHIVRLCALELGDIDWYDIISCSMENKGRELLHQMALRTKAFERPENSYLPIVTVNGIFVDDIEEIQATDFVNLICQNYQGPFPYGCRNEKSNPTHSCRTA